MVKGNVTGCHHSPTIVLRRSEQDIEPYRRKRRWLPSSNFSTIGCNSGEQGPRRPMAQDKRFRVNIADDEATRVTRQILQVCSGRILHQFYHRRFPTKDPVEILG